MKKIVSAILVFVFLFTIYRLTPSIRDLTEQKAFQQDIYTEILDNIDLQCVENTSAYSISATIDGKAFCFYEESPEQFTLFAGKGGASNHENDETYRYKTITLTLGNQDIHHRPYFQFYFPNTKVNGNVYTHLDSIFAIGHHTVKGTSEVMVPEEFSDGEKSLLKSGLLSWNNFQIEFNTLHKNSDSSNSGTVFSLNSESGIQENSFIRFNTVEKIEESGETYYYLDIDFKCDLYHHPAHGHEGIWGKVTDGKIITKVKLSGDIL